MSPPRAHRARWVLAALRAAGVAMAALGAACDRGQGPEPAAGPGAAGRPPAPPAAASVAELKETGPQTCVACHRGLHPELVRAHEAGPHGAKVACADCHGTDHALMFSTKGEVSSAKCGSCHAARYEEFRKSRHGHLLKGGAMTDTLRAHATAVGGCGSTNGCHDVQRQNADGSVGRCASCHPSHAATRGEAGNPAICARCHSGPDHPQWEAWSADKHGVLWRRDPTSGLAPSCATCHMPGASHDDGQGITVSVVERTGQPSPTLVTTMPRDAAVAARTAMLAVCARCHGTRLSRTTLEQADDARFDALMMCEEAAGIVRGLDAERLLVPAPKDRPKNPVSDGGLVLGGKQIYDEHASRAERLFYDMFMFDWPALWRACYHTDPNLVRWTARERLKTDLIEIRAEAERLRAAKR
jgi:hydroxylamine dehydrogenase